MKTLQCQLDNQNKCIAVYNLEEIPKNKKILRGYIRCSTRIQVEEGFTIPSQTAIIKDFADKNNYHIVAIYYDRGISGKYGEDVRLGLGQLIKDILPTESLIVISQDRLYRNTAKAATLADLLRDKKCGLIIISMNNGIDINSDNNSNFLFKLMCTIAENERNQISTRVKANVRHMIDNDLYKAKPYFGMMSPGYKKELIPNPKEMEVVDYIRSLRVENKNIILARIVERLNEKYPPGDYNIREWHPTTVHNIIKNHNIPDEKYLKKMGLDDD